MLKGFLEFVMLNFLGIMYCKFGILIVSFVISLNFRTYLFMQHLQRWDSHTNKSTRKASENPRRLFLSFPFLSTATRLPKCVLKN